MAKRRSYGNNIDVLFAKWKHEDRLNNKKWYHNMYPFYKKVLWQSLPYSLTQNLDKRVAFKHTFRYNIRYRLSHPWTAYQDIRYEVKSFFQRGFYGFSNGDVGNFHIHLAEIMPHILKNMTGEHNYTVCYEAIKEAAEKLGFDPADAWGTQENKISRENQTLILALGTAIEDAWYIELADAFQRYYDIICGPNMNIPWDEQDKIINECKSKMHGMIDRFEHLST